EFTTTDDFRWSTFASSQCGLQHSILPGNQYQIYSGELRVRSREYLPFRSRPGLGRIIYSSLFFAIMFPLNVTIQTTPIVVHGPPNLHAAIVVQDYDSSTRTAVVVLLTQLQSPYKLLSVN